MVPYSCPHPYLLFHLYPQLPNVTHPNQLPSIHINYTSIIGKSFYTPSFLNLSNPSSPTFFVAWLLWLNVTWCHICFVLLIVIMVLNLLSLGILVQAAPYGVFNVSNLLKVSRGYDRVFPSTITGYHRQRNTHRTNSNQ